MPQRRRHALPWFTKRSTPPGVNRCSAVSEIDPGCQPSRIVTAVSFSNVRAWVIGGAPLHPPRAPIEESTAVAWSIAARGGMRLVQRDEARLGLERACPAILCLTVGAGFSRDLVATVGGINPLPQQQNPPHFQRELRKHIDAVP